MSQVTIVLNTGEHFRGTWSLTHAIPNVYALTLESESLFEEVFIPADNVRFIITERPNVESPKTQHDLVEALEKAWNPDKR